MQEYIKQALTESAQLKLKIAREQADLVAEVCKTIVEAFRCGNKLLVAGNGGSAADAQHIAAEFVGRFKMERPALPAIALTTDTSVLTAVANDYGFDTVFARQVEAHAKAGDVLLVISTSGNSPNVLSAIEKAGKSAVHVIGLSGGDGGKLAELANLCLIVPGKDTPRIQEAHITLGHIICDLVEKELFDN